MAAPQRGNRCILPRQRLPLLVDCGLQGTNLHAGAGMREAGPCLSACTPVSPAAFAHLPHPPTPALDWPARTHLRFQVRDPQVERLGR